MIEDVFLLQYNLLKMARLLLPGLILLGCGALLLNQISTLSYQYLQLLSWLPYLLAGMSLILAVSFNQGRLFLSSINLSALFLLIQTDLQTSLNNPATFVLFSIISLWFPLQQLLIAFYPERGFSWRWAAPRAAIILCGYLLLGLLYQQGVLTGWIVDLPMGLMEQAWSDGLLSQWAMWLFLMVTAFQLVILYFRATLADAALLTATLGIAVMLLLFHKPYISVVSSSLILILILVTILFNSYSMAFIDELTGLPGRRALENALNSAGRHYTLAMVDVDHFKKFNDTYGHDVGDQVLRMVASQMKKAARGASVFRYGGEEFTLVFRGKSEAEAFPVAEQVREAVAGYPMRLRDKDRPTDEKQGRRQRNSRQDSDTVQVCISLGLCEKTAEHKDSQAVIKQADESLYKAKQQGRNRTVATHMEAKPRQRKAASA